MCPAPLAMDARLAVSQPHPHPHPTLARVMTGTMGETCVALVGFGGLVCPPSPLPIVPPHYTVCVRGAGWYYDAIDMCSETIMQGLFKMVCP